MALGYDIELGHTEPRVVSPSERPILVAKQEVNRPKDVRAAKEQVERWTTDPSIDALEFAAQVGSSRRATTSGAGALNVGRGSISRELRRFVSRPTTSK